MSFATRALPADDLVALLQDLLDGLHRVAEIADLEADTAERGCGFGLRFLDFHLRELLLELPHLVFEFLLRDLRLPQVRLIGFFGLLQLLRVGREIGLQLLQLAREACRPAPGCRRGDWRGSGAPDPVRASPSASPGPSAARRHPPSAPARGCSSCILPRNSWRAASISASGFASSMPADEQAEKPAKQSADPTEYRHSFLHSCTAYVERNAPTPLSARLAATVSPAPSFPLGRRLT